MDEIFCYMHDNHYSFVAAFLMLLALSVLRSVILWKAANAPYAPRKNPLVPNFENHLNALHSMSKRRKGVARACDCVMFALLAWVVANEGGRALGLCAG